MLTDNSEFFPIIQELETTYAHRNLIFTETFEGFVPMQSYGWIDGMRFYFRFRSDKLSLIVGPLDLEAEKRHAIRNGQTLEEMILPTGYEYDYYPLTPTWASTIEAYTGSPFAGSLSPLNAQQGFTALVEKLKRTPQ
jgi:hypothetical protein